MSELFHYFQTQEKEMVEDLLTLVAAESPSEEKKLVDACGDVLASLFEKRLGVKEERIPQEDRGDHRRFVVGNGEVTRTLILGHFDTVWDKGRLPIHEEDGKLFGPGVLDMKSGIILSMWAVKALQEADKLKNQTVVFLCTSDEEVGSQTSRPLIEKEAKKSDVVLVTEPPEAKTGDLKTARKGVGIYNVKVKGVSSHAGNHHEEGVSAIRELAQQIVTLEQQTDYAQGTTVNVGVIQGGSRRNVVPDEAEALVDFRVTTAEEADKMIQVFESLEPTTAHAELIVEGELNRPPMERTEKTAYLFSLAKVSADEIGMNLSETTVGGGSDGNFTAALGIPTLDGLGCLGEGPHAEHEHIVREELPKRAALFAHLVEKLEDYK
ncbi:M20 family metallopeptidase [Bacillus fonticola]|uniref:M20 family metallopeptidase n=1 Tax=Bacillus fonticola TaxID=2728853 RepID=UPI001473F85E|nr:M20 family metallopeptidase [Bacillus fonticola]